MLEITPAAAQEEIKSKTEIDQRNQAVASTLLQPKEIMVTMQHKQDEEVTAVLQDDHGDEDECSLFFELGNISKKKLNKSYKAAKVSVQWKTATNANITTHNNNKDKKMERHPNLLRSWSKKPISFDKDGEDDDSSTNSEDNTFEDMLDFYSCAHHDQDEAFTNRASKEQAKKREHELNELHSSLEKIKERLNTLLNQKWSRETEAFQKRAKEKHLAMMKKQKFQRAQLTTTQEKRLEGFRSKVQERIAHLSNTINASLSAPNAATTNSNTILETQQQLRYWQRYEQEERQKLQQRFQEQLQMLRTHHSMRQEELLLEFTEEKARIKASRQHQLSYHHTLFRKRAEQKKKEVLKSCQTHRYYLHDLEHRELLQYWLNDDAGITEEGHPHSLPKTSMSTSSAIASAITTATDDIKRPKCKSNTGDSLVVAASKSCPTTAANDADPAAAAAAATSALTNNAYHAIDTATASNLVGEEEEETVKYSSNAAANSNRKNGTSSSRASSPSFYAPLVLRGEGRKGTYSSANYIRQKMRKSVTSGIPIQLAIDLHNEGIVVHYRSAADNYGTPTAPALRGTARTTATTNNDDAGGRNSPLPINISSSPSKISSDTTTDAAVSEVATKEQQQLNIPTTDNSTVKNTSPHKTAETNSKLKNNNISDNDNYTSTTSCNNAVMITNENKEGVDLPHSGGKWSSGNGAGRSEFIAWGIRARKLLHSIFCGEVPKGYSADEIDSDAKGVLQGGQIKCMVTDMRTSDRVASAQRALAAQSIDKRKCSIKKEDLEKETATIDVETLKGEERVKIATKDAERARKECHKLQSKTNHCWRPDGSFAVNQLGPEDRSSIESFIAAKKKFAAADNRLNDAKRVACDLKLKKEKIESQLKLMDRSDEEDLTSDRIADVLSAIRVTMEQRRLQLDKKRMDHESFGFYQTPSQDLATALKASFRQKMEHRRLVIVLRPNGQSMLGEVQKAVLESIKSANLNTKVDENAVFLRAEQLLLLALHPAAPEGGLPTVPPASASKADPGSKPWAEPGWHLVLNVDPPKSSSSSTNNVLPALDLSTTFRHSLADCTSASGRQSSALLPACFFRMLTAPLSKLCEASAPAEPPESKKFNHAQLEFDPFQTTENAMEVGYSFTLPHVRKIPAATIKSKRPSIENSVPTSKKSRSSSVRKPAKEESLQQSSSKTTVSANADDNVATHRPDRANKSTRSLQQTPSIPAVADRRRSSLMTEETRVPRKVQQVPVVELQLNSPPQQQLQQQQQQRAAQPMYSTQNRCFVMDPMQQQQYQQHQPPQQQQQPHQADLLRRSMSNPLQQALPSSSRAVQTMPPMNQTMGQTMGQTPAHIPQYFHHPQPAQVQQHQTTAAAAAQQARQQQLLQQQQQQQLQMAQMQRVMQAPTQPLGQSYPYGGQAAYGQPPPPPPFSHVSRVAPTGHMVLPSPQAQPINGSYGMPHPPRQQQQPGQVQQIPQNANEDYDPLFMIFNQ